MTNHIETLNSAVHEAGHAVMACYFGFGLKSVTIDSPNPEDPGACVCWVSVPGIIYDKEHVGWKRWQALEKYACVRLAGYAAVLLHGIPYPKGRGGFTADLAKCKEIFDSMGYKPSEQREVFLTYLLTARRILRQPGNWGAVLELADVLLNKKTVEADESRTIIENCSRRKAPIWDSKGRQGVQLSLFS